MLKPFIGQLFSSCRVAAAHAPLKLMSQSICVAQLSGVNGDWSVSCTNISGRQNYSGGRNNLVK